VGGGFPGKRGPEEGFCGKVGVPITGEII